MPLDGLLHISDSNNQSGPGAQKCEFIHTGDVFKANERDIQYECELVCDDLGFTGMVDVKVMVDDAMHYCRYETPIDDPDGLCRFKRADCVDGYLVEHSELYQAISGAPWNTELTDDADEEDKEEAMETALDTLESWLEPITKAVSHAIEYDIDYRLMNEEPAAGGITGISYAFVGYKDLSFIALGNGCIDVEIRRYNKRVKREAYFINERMAEALERNFEKYPHQDAELTRCLMGILRKEVRTN